MMDEDEVEVEIDEPEKEEIKAADQFHKTTHIVPPNERITSQVMTKYEVVEAIGIRIAQIERGATVFTNVTGMTTATQMAKKEFIDRQSPLTLVRHVPHRKADENNEYVEHWKVREMEFPISDHDIADLPKKQLESIIKALK